MILRNISSKMQRKHGKYLIKLQRYRIWTLVQAPSLTHHLADNSIMVIQVEEFWNEGYKIREIFDKKSKYLKEIIEFWELV